jgi:hypothetical protein
MFRIEGKNAKIKINAITPHWATRRGQFAFLVFNFIIKNNNHYILGVVKFKNNVFYLDLVSIKFKINFKFDQSLPNE